MRFMYDYNDIPDVCEIEDIDAAPVWDRGANVNEDLPISLVVTLYRTGWMIAPAKNKDLFEIIGEYLLDGTKETYDKAVKNYSEVCLKLLEKGFCKASDFENFDWD